MVEKDFEGKNAQLTDPKRTAESMAWATKVLVVWGCGSGNSGLLIPAILAIWVDDGPSDAGRARRLEWAQLLKRVFAIDVLTCKHCNGPMRLVSVVSDEDTASKILVRLGLPSRAPRAESAATHRASNSSLRPTTTPRIPRR